MCVTLPLLPESLEIPAWLGGSLQAGACQPIWTPRTGRRRPVPPPTLSLKGEALEVTVPEAACFVLSDLFADLTA